MKMTKKFRTEVKHAISMWGKLERYAIQNLWEVEKRYCLSIASGDLQLINKRWYITHAGLLRLARRNSCHGISVQLISDFCEPSASSYTFCAIVYTSPTCKGFAGYGDANPSNVSYLVQGAELRIAETRAVNRALRKAYGI